ncbi:hypothetical protein [Phycicoccus sp.]|uniref:hypothetical protein n=1 Tax=Phycicoccus sp. TaxID=1902410 RepID=UPI002B97AC26|nr:hypothetical protein [Phycicoccus sp.]HMM93977.1 hypothetical protein [Phycicoccus sp.]
MNDLKIPPAPPVDRAGDRWPRHKHRARVRKHNRARRARLRRRYGHTEIKETR